MIDRELLTTSNNTATNAFGPFVDNRLSWEPPAGTRQGLCCNNNEILSKEKPVIIRDCFGFWMAGPSWPYKQ